MNGMTLAAGPTIPTPDIHSFAQPVLNYLISPAVVSVFAIAAGVTCVWVGLSFIKGWIGNVTVTRGIDGNTYHFRPSGNYDDYEAGLDYRGRTYGEWKRDVRSENAGFENRSYRKHKRMVDVGDYGYY